MKVSFSFLPQSAIITMILATQPLDVGADEFWGEVPVQQTVCTNKPFDNYMTCVETNDIRSCEDDCIASQYPGIQGQLMGFGGGSVGAIPCDDFRGLVCNQLLGTCPCIIPCVNELTSCIESSPAVQEVLGTDCKMDCPASVSGSSGGVGSTSGGQGSGSNGSGEEGGEGGDNSSGGGEDHGSDGGDEDCGDSNTNDYYYDYYYDTYDEDPDSDGGDEDNGATNDDYYDDNNDDHDDLGNY
jgi:hypothetical protein